MKIPPDHIIFVRDDLLQRPLHTCIWTNVTNEIISKRFLPINFPKTNFPFDYPKPKLDTSVNLETRSSLQNLIKLTFMSEELTHMCCLYQCVALRTDIHVKLIPNKIHVMWNWTTTLLLFIFKVDKIMVFARNIHAIYGALSWLLNNLEGIFFCQLFISHLSLNGSFINIHIQQLCALLLV